MPAVVLRGRPISLRPNERRAEDPVYDQLACNKNPRHSLAGLLPARELRRFKAAPGVYGRLPAPRTEYSCEGAPELPAVVEWVLPDFARGASPLPPNKPGGPPIIPPVEPGPEPGPGPGPSPGPGPAPGPLPGPGPREVPGPCECVPGGPPMWVRGHPRVINFHLTGVVGGGAANTELRAGPRIERPFIIRSIEIVPVTTGGIGQYVDVFVASSDWTGDVAIAPGVSIFDRQQGLADVPTEDEPGGLPVTDLHYDVPMAFEVVDKSRVIFVQTQFVAPAIALPTLHVVVVIEEFDTLGDPIVPRPPVGPPPIEVRPPYAPAPGPEENPDAPAPRVEPVPVGPPVSPPPTVSGSYRRWTNSCLVQAFRDGRDAYAARCYPPGPQNQVLRGAEAKAFDSWYARTVFVPSVRRPLVGAR